MKTLLAVLGMIEQATKINNLMTLKEVEDTLIDAIEDRIASTSNKIDDALILPVIKFIRFTANIPDNDETNNIKVKK